MIVADNGDICVRWLGLPWQEVVPGPCFPRSALGQVLAPVAGWPGICMTLPVHGLQSHPRPYSTDGHSRGQTKLLRNTRRHRRHGHTCGRWTNYRLTLAQPLLVLEIGGRMWLWPGDLDRQPGNTPPPPDPPPVTRHTGPGIRSRPRALTSPFPPTPRPSPEHGPRSSHTACMNGIF